MSELEICLSDTEFLAGKPLPHLRAAIAAEVSATVEKCAAALLKMSVEARMLSRRLSDAGDMDAAKGALADATAIKDAAERLPAAMNGGGA